MHWQRQKFVVLCTSRHKNAVVDAGRHYGCVILAAKLDRILILTASIHAAAEEHFLPVQRFVESTVRKACTNLVSPTRTKSN